MYTDDVEPIDLGEGEGPHLAPEQLAEFVRTRYWIGVPGRIMKYLGLIGMLVFAALLIFIASVQFIGGDDFQRQVAALFFLTTMVFASSFTRTSGGHLHRAGRCFTAVADADGRDLKNLLEGMKAVNRGFFNLFLALAIGTSSIFLYLALTLLTWFDIIPSS